MIPIIKWTLWQRRWSTMWWSVGVFGLIFINMIFYPTFKDQAAELQKSFDQLPEAAVQLFGGSTDFFSPVGFLNSQIFFLMLPMVLVILAIALGSSLIGREEQDLTLENLLARPVSRTQVLAAKAVAGKIILLIVTLVGLATTLITARIVGLDEVSVGDMALATLSCFLLALCVGALSFVFTAFGRARSASIGIAAFVALGGYLVSSLAGTVDWLREPARAFPFYYYKSEDILRGHFDWTYLMFFVAVIVLCAGLSWWSFRGRDLG